MLFVKFYLFQADIADAFIHQDIGKPLLRISARPF
jgi:hypothetical protein